MGFHSPLIRPAISPGGGSFGGGYLRFPSNNLPNLHQLLQSDPDGFPKWRSRKNSPQMGPNSRGDDLKKLAFLCFQGCIWHSEILF